MEILKVCAAAIICAIICLLLNRCFNDFTTAFSIVVTTALFITVCRGISEIVDFASFLNSSTDETELISYLLKALGVLLITEISADICERAGETVLSKTVLSAGRIEIMVIALPLFKAIINLATKLCG